MKKITKNKQREFMILLKSNKIKNTIFNVTRE
jgi:hypothetical protein